MPTVYFNVCVCPFCDIVSPGVVSGRLSASAGPALHLLSQDPFILSAPPLSLHALYLSPTLSGGGGEGMCWESMNEKYERKKGHQSVLMVKMSGLINLHNLRSKCIFIKPIVQATAMTVSSAAQAVARLLDCFSAHYPAQQNCSCTMGNLNGANCLLQRHYCCSLRCWIAWLAPDGQCCTKVQLLGESPWWQMIPSSTHHFLLSGWKRLLCH